MIEILNTSKLKAKFYFHDKIVKTLPEFGRLNLGTETNGRSVFTPYAQNEGIQRPNESEIVICNSSFFFIF